MTVAVKALLGLLAMTLPAVGPSELGHPVPELNRGPRNLPLVALTFDAGRGIDGLEDLLNTLERERVMVPFFLTGRLADEHPAWAHEIARRGHTIGNYSWGHKDFANLEDWEVHMEILRVDDLFSMTSGTRLWAGA